VLGEKEREKIPESNGPKINFQKVRKKLPESDGTAASLFNVFSTHSCLQD